LSTHLFAKAKNNSFDFCARPVIMQCNAYFMCAVTQGYCAVVALRATLLRVAFVQNVAFVQARGQAELYIGTDIFFFLFFGRGKNVTL
jgi:hypothetical protein